VDSTEEKAKSSVADNQKANQIIQKLQLEFQRIKTKSKSKKLRIKQLEGAAMDKQGEVEKSKLELINQAERMREKDVEILQLKTKIDQMLQDLNGAHEEISRLRHSVNAQAGELEKLQERQKFSFAPTHYNPALAGRSLSTVITPQYKSTASLISNNTHNQATPLVLSPQQPISPTKPQQDRSSIVFSTANINPNKFQS